jgi:hypothetical protein
LKPSFHLPVCSFLSRVLLYAYYYEKSPHQEKVNIPDADFLFLKFMQRFIPRLKRLETCRLDYYATGKLLHFDEDQVK